MIVIIKGHKLKVIALLPINFFKEVIIENRIFLGRLEYYVFQTSVVKTKRNSKPKFILYDVIKYHLV